MQTVPKNVDATTIANALYVQARDQYRAALNRAAELTHASPSVRARAIGQLDRCAAALRMAMSRLDFMSHPGPDHLPALRD